MLPPPSCPIGQLFGTGQERSTLGGAVRVVQDPLTSVLFLLLLLPLLLLLLLLVWQLQLLLLLLLLLRLLCELLV